MASKKKQVNTPQSEKMAGNVKVDIVVPEVKAPETDGAGWGIGSFRLQAIILALVGFVLYCNTFKNGFAFDDMLVIVQNEYVQQGFAGIPKIVGGDAYESFTHLQNEQNNQLTGGRYRPLSIMTFAVEQQFLGLNVGGPGNNTFEERQIKLDKDMHFRHVVNVLLYMLSIVVLLYFLRKIVFPGNPLAAFLAALIFTVHPIHTEVVANVKSRDEILSSLFITLTLILAFKHRVSGKMKDLVLAMVYFLLAVLSKEYGVLLIVLLPLAFYMFDNYSVKKSVTASLIYLVPLGVYLMLRFSAVRPAVEVSEDDVMNYPYVFATAAEKLASEFAVMLDYIKLLLFPHPLSSDYSYKQIPYSDFSSIKVWLSLVVYSGLIGGMYLLLKRRHIMGFAIAFYLLFLMLVCNIFVNIGAPMGERLVFLSSLGFAMALAWLLAMAYKKIQPAMAANVVIGGLVAVIVVLSGFKTIERNQDWESNTALFLKDVKTVPNSVIANANAGMASMELANKVTDSLKKRTFLTDAKTFLSQSINLNKRFVVAYVNRCVCNTKLGDMEAALADCDSVRKYFPVHPSLPAISKPISDYFVAKGIEYGTANRIPEAIVAFRKATDATPGEPDLWYDLGFSLSRNGQVKEGIEALNRTIQLKPGHPQALQLLQQLNATGVH